MTQKNQLATAALGSKTAWILVSNVSANSLASTLELVDCQSVSFEEAVEAASRYPNMDAALVGSFDNRVQDLVIIPTRQNHCLLYSDNFFLLGAPECYECLERLTLHLSETYREAQAFVTHSGPECHGWILAREGRLIRSFGYTGESDEVFRNHGEPTSGESDFIDCLSALSNSLTEPSYKSDSEASYPTEDMVWAIATNWGVNPTCIVADTEQSCLIGSSSWHLLMPPAEQLDNLSSLLPARDIKTISNDLYWTMFPSRPWYDTFWFKVSVCLFITFVTAFLIRQTL